MALIPWPPDPGWLADTESECWFFRAGTDILNEDNWNKDCSAWHAMFDAGEPAPPPAPPPNPTDASVPDWLRPTVEEARRQLTKLGSWFANFSLLAIIQTVLDNNTFFTPPNPIGVLIRQWGPGIVNPAPVPAPPPPVVLPPIVPAPVPPVIPSSDIHTAAVNILAFWPDRNQAITMLAIAGAESGFRAEDGDNISNYDAPDQIRFAGDTCNGWTSFGYLQVNIPYNRGTVQRLSGFSSPCDMRQWLFQPTNQAQAARAIFDSQGFGAWTTYRRGTHGAYINQATTVIDGLIASPEPPIVPVPIQPVIDDIYQRIADVEAEGREAVAGLDQKTAEGLAAEYTDRVASDEALGLAITEQVQAEATARLINEAEIVGSLDVQITTEADARRSGDLTLQVIIDTEITDEAATRAAADVAVRDTLRSELTHTAAAVTFDAHHYTDARVQPQVDWINNHQADVALLHTAVPVLTRLTTNPAAWLCDTLVTLPVTCFESLLVKLWDGP